MNAKNAAVEVEGLGKRYRIGLKEQRHENLASAFIDAIKSPIKNYREHRSAYDFRDIDSNGLFEDSADIIWPLKNVSFNVFRGEAVGIIGRNGAGKSTLLKVLSKITPPTTGEIRLRGRVSSLLEVGTGFHQELTGRENVYLNGNIIGMRTREVDRKFDQIVEFSGVEKFLDTPVKRYSSGMRVRLAFAVSAYLEPEILVVDEVLAVGDAEFQRKCLDKMQDVGREGCTILFVSHNMNTITRLCERVILLEDGRIAMDGAAHDVVSHYLSSGAGLLAERQWSEREAPANNVVRLWGVRARAEDGQITASMDIRKSVAIEMEYEVLEAGHVLDTFYHIFNDERIKICTTIDRNSAWHNCPRAPGLYTSRAWIPGDLLNEGVFYVNLVIRDSRTRGMPHVSMRDAITFQVVDTLGDNDADAVSALRREGVIRSPLKWELESLSRN